MAQEFPPTRLAELALFKNEWAALLECAAPSPQPGRFSALLAPVDWSRLLLLAEEHGVLAQR